MEESGFEVDDMKVYTSFDPPSVHHHALSKNKVGMMNFYDRFQRFSIDDSYGNLACTGLDQPSHLPCPSPTRKRVTFDSKVKTYQHSAVEKSVELFEEKKKEEKVKTLKSRQATCSSEGRSHVISNSSGSYRYQNCRESDSDDEEEHVTDCDDSDDDGGLLDDYYEDKWDSEVYTQEIEDDVALDIDKSNASTARDRSGYVNPLLNPIENLTQWKAVKSEGRTTQTQHREEQNSNLIFNQEHKLNASFTPLASELSSFSIKQKPRDETKKQTTRQVAVDASLSTSQTHTTQNFSRKPIRSGERYSILQRFHP